MSKHRLVDVSYNFSSHIFRALYLEENESSTDVNTALRDRSARKS